MLASGVGSLVAFAQMIRATTPEGADPMAPGATPEYSVLAPPTFGHLIGYVARRATTANNFGPYIDAVKYEATLAFFRSTTESRAIEIAERLGSRFVLTHDRANRGPPLLEKRRLDTLHWLQREDGVGRSGSPSTARFRLITEGPRGGEPLRIMFPSSRPGARILIPYKLFEIVPGAVLEAEARPGTRLTASVCIATPFQRHFEYRALGRADPSGTVRVRVAYATDTQSPAHPTSPYHVRLGNRIYSASVSDADVQQGRVIPLIDGASADRVAHPATACPVRSPGES